MDEKEIIRKIKEGDQTAFTELFATYQPKILQHCLSVVKDQEIAEDLSQETFLQAYKKFDTFRQDSSFYTWLFRIAHNLSLNQLKKMKKGKIEEFHDESFLQLPVQQQEHPELEKAVQEGIKTLNEKHAEVFKLYEIEKKSQKEIAMLLNIPNGTVRSRLYYARRKMRSYLSNYTKNMK
jgi:RNA polymerase sigma-70 factor (ECF subfamily)